MCAVLCLRGPWQNCILAYEIYIYIYIHIPYIICMGTAVTDVLQNMGKHDYYCGPCASS
jgi:hypothetical protein